MRLKLTPKSYGVQLFDKAMDHNIVQIRNAVEAAVGNKPRADLRVLDLGCWDGQNMLRYVPAGVQMFGAEMSPDAGLQAKAAGIEVSQADLNEPIPWDDNFFDIVTSNQVIEHIADTDKFVSETFRTLKPGGTAVISTENMSSWHNIGALLFGWQAFSLTNISDRSAGIGNPISLLRGEEPAEFGWQHIRIFSYRGLKELFQAHGFRDVRVVGAGYYPLPTQVANIDPRHAAFIAVIGTKPRS